MIRVWRLYYRICLLLKFRLESKLIFSKTEMILINLDSLEATRLVASIYCKLFTFSLKYLDVPLSDKKMKIYE
jgi:hypothetical protein